jgi:hypothetical protein
VRALAGFIHGLIMQETGSRASDAPGASAPNVDNTPKSDDRAETPAVDLDTLDEDDLSALLAQKLSRLRS